MNNLNAQTAYVGSTEIKQVRKGDRLILAPNGNKLWYDSNELPSLDLRFAEDKSLVDATTGSNLIDFTRASSGTYVGSDGLIKTAVTNLVLQSEDFSTTWFNFNSSESVNAAIAPDGKLTANKLIPDVGVTNGLIRQDFSSGQFASDTQFCLSVYAKAAELDVIAVTFYNNANTFCASGQFNLSTGAFVTNGANATRFATPISDGWYRVGIIFSSGTGANVTNVRIVCPSTGNGTSGIYIWGAQLEQSDTVGEYVKTTSTINSAPRFDHDPTTGESLGLLVEESRTNLLLRSEEFDNDTVWTKTGSSGTANAITAPNGLVTADKLVEDNSTGSHFARQDISTTAAVRTASIYLKAGERSLLRIEHVGNTGNAGRRITVDLAAGSITAASTIGSGGLTSADQSIVSVGNGWYRFISTIEPITTTGDTASLLVILLDAGGNSSYTGDNTSGIYMWGAQLEAGSFPTSYIPTDSSTVTRAADVASISGSNFSSWFNASDGSIFNDSRIIKSSTQTQVVYHFDGTNYDISLRQPHLTGDQFRANIGNVFTASPGTGGTLSGGATKAAVAYSGTAGRLQVGSLGDNVTMAGTLDANQVFIGSLGIGTQLNGTLKRLTYWPTRLPNDTLQTITQ